MSKITGTIIGSNVIVDSEVSNSFNQSPIGKSLSNNDIAYFVKLLYENISELKLSTSDQKKVEAQLATINAQLSTEPDSSIIKKAGKTIKNVLESAIGSLLANAIQPSEAWINIQSLLSRF